MRRRSLVLISLLALGALAAQVAPVAAAKGATTLWATSGEGVSAYWSTEPTSGQPVVGVLYTTTTLSASSGVFRDSDGKTKLRNLGVIQEVHMYDASGAYIVVSTTSGDAGAKDVKLKVDGSLTKASVKARVTLSTCTPQAVGDSICVDGGTADLVASWSGAGDLISSPTFLQTENDGYTETLSGNWEFRPATVSAWLDGVNLSIGAGTVSADMSRASSRTILVCHVAGGC
jgi:hypothetical protein